MSFENDNKEHPIAIGSNSDPSIDNDPKSMNRVRRVAPCPEFMKPKEGEPKKFLSGGGSRGLKGHTGSGKGPLEHKPGKFAGKGGKEDTK